MLDRGCLETLRGRELSAGLSAEPPPPHGATLAESGPLHAGCVAAARRRVELRLHWVERAPGAGPRSKARRLLAGGGAVV